MSRSREKTVLTEETKMMVTSFYNKVAQECFYRKSTFLVYGLKQPVKFLEKTLTWYCQQFKLENLAVIIGQTSFENLRPKNVKLKFQAQR